MKLLSTLAKFKALIGAIKLTQEPLVDGSLIQYDTDEITSGEPVFLVDGAGDWALLPDGLYQTKSQMHFTITEGVVSDVNKNGMVKNPEQSGPTIQAMENQTPETPINETPVSTELEIALPGAGAPDNLVDPALISADDSYSTCMQRLNELHAQHMGLQSMHSQLRTEHDAVNGKLNEMIGKHNSLATKCDEMMSKINQFANDKLQMSRQIETLSKMPAGEPIETVKVGGFAAVDPKVAESRAFKILHGE